MFFQRVTATTSLSPSTRTCAFLNVRTRLILKTCFNVLKEFATSSRLKPGHAGYKRHLQDVIARGGFARRSARLACRS